MGDHQQIFVQNLAKAVDVKGQYKTSHSQNTADLAKAICKELSLNEKTSDLIHYAGLLQNIGKITLPEKIFANNVLVTSGAWSGTLGKESAFYADSIFLLFDIFLFTFGFSRFLFSSITISG